MLPLYSLSSTISLEDTFSLPFTTLEKDWYDNPLSFLAQFVVAIDNKHLFLACSCDNPPSYETSVKSGDFREGLWHFDAIELFLKEDHSNKYQEFNLNPGGAWWTGLFHNYRQEDKINLVIPSGVNCLSVVRDDSWQAAIQIPLKSLSVAVAFEQETRASVCLTVNHPKKIYISHNHSGNEKPDFHLPINYEELTKVTLMNL